MTAHYEIFGRVQGVGYRFFVVECGRRLGLEGWVRNRADGSVVAAARGGPDDLARFLAHLRQGPAGAQVERVVETRLADPAGNIEPGRFEIVREERI